MAKHGWNSLQNYLDVHDRTLRFYHRYMEEPREYLHEKYNDQYHTLTCLKIFVTTYKGTRVRIDIKKDIEIDSSNPNRLKARTFEYSYSANIPRGGELVRFCSPHDDDDVAEGSAPHHKHHHKHEFSKNPKGDVILLGKDDWPHVGEFFEEVLSRF